LNQLPTEILYGLQSKVTTEVFITDKEKFDKIPTTDKSKENNSRIGNKKRTNT